MNRNRIARPMLASLVAVVTLMLAVPQAHARASIGATIGFTRLASEDESVFLISAPSTTDVFFSSVVPGLRFGLMEHVRTAPVLELGMSVLSGEGETLTTLQIGGHLRHYLGSRPDAGPYLTLGVGLIAVSYEGESDSRPLFGGGIGATHPVADDHGRVRFELRYDRITEDEEEFQPALNAISLKVGFDLLSSP